MTTFSETGPPQREAPTPAVEEGAGAEGELAKKPQENYTSTAGHRKAETGGLFSEAYRHGLSPFPIPRGQKKPVTKWRLFQTERASNEQVRIWDETSDNVGIATGPVSGVLVLDLDSEEARLEAERLGYLAPDTPVVKTGKGWHYYYRCPAQDAIRNSAGKLGPRMDIRGKGGYVVAAGSLHATGQVYTWLKSPDNVPFAEPPAALLEALQKPKRSNPHQGERGPRSTTASAELDQLVEDVGAAVEGTRNETLNKAGFRAGQLIAAGRVDRNEAEDRLRQAAFACGLLDEEIQGTLAHSIDEGMANPRAMEADSTEFTRDEQGRPFSSPRNARVALARLGVTVAYDEFAARYLVNDLPGFGPHLDDPALTRLRLQLEERWNLKFFKERWADILLDYARRNTFHPVRDYLSELRWDGIQRADRWLTTYGGAEDSEYTRAVGAIVLIAAVRRVRRPGCKFDEMLVLESSQGTDKSSALALLAVQEDWFTDDLPLDADSKVVMERTAGRWLVELAELKGLRRGAVEHVKSTLSRRVDKARLAYGRMPTEQPRQCVFFGTTNDHKYLQDPTGNRRFWPVKVQAFDIEALRRDRDQLWAEAAAREAQGASIRLPLQLWAAAGEQQAGREIGDPFEEILLERLDSVEGKVRAEDIWEAVGLSDRGKRTQVHNMRLSAVMQKLGWSRPKSKLRFGAEPRLAWVKGEPDEASGSFPEVCRKTVLGLDKDGQDRRPF